VIVEGGGAVSGVPVSTFTGGGVVVSVPLGAVTAPLGSTVVVVVSVVSALATVRLHSRAPVAPTIESIFMVSSSNPDPTNRRGRSFELSRFHS
jgi:hypothetical protein